LIQIFASDEQTKLLQELALSAEGIQPLPNEFRSLKWLAHTTTTISDEGKRTEWRCDYIEKLGDTGRKFAVYKLPGKTLIGTEAYYTCTFIGLKACVVAIISLGDERTTVFIFDTPVPAAGIYFGPGYLTDWSGRRDLAIAVIGTGTMPDLKVGWPTTIKNAFKEWKGNVEWGLESYFSVFDKGESSNKFEK